MRSGNELVQKGLCHSELTRIWVEMKSKRNILFLLGVSESQIKHAVQCHSETSSGWHKFPRPLWERGRERGRSLSNYSFSCTPCRGAFGGKSTAKPPTRQHSHQTKNSYSSRITRHFVPQTNSAFVVYSFCLIVHFWLLSDFWPNCHSEFSSEWQPFYFSNKNILTFVTKIHSNFKV